MMNFASYHKVVTIKKIGEGPIILEDVQLMVSGNFLIVNGTPSRDEENKQKSVTSHVFNLDEVESYDTITKYYPEEGLENRQQING